MFEGRVTEGDPNSVGHVITTNGGSGTGRQTIRYVTERVVGNGSFGVVFQARCLETGETVSSPVATSGWGRRWEALKDWRGAGCRRWR